MYPWLVFVHIVGVLLFLFAHGVSAAMALRLRHERHPDRIRVLLQISGSSVGVFYVGVALLLLGGIWAGFVGGWWGSAWIWVSLAVFVGNMALMYAVAFPYYRRIREVMTIEESDAAAVRPDELDTLLRSSRPTALAWIGMLSIAFIAYLMVLKPF